MKPVMNMTVAELIQLGYDVDIYAHELNSVDDARIAVCALVGGKTAEISKCKDTYGMTYFKAKPQNSSSFKSVSITAFTKSEVAKDEGDNQ